MNNLIVEPTLQLLDFRLDDVQVCIELQYVIKILPLVYLDSVPGSPAYLAGLMNIAGRSIPVIDLAIRLGLQRVAPYSLDSSILLCKKGQHLAGMIVDKVLDLLCVKSSALQMNTEFNDADSLFLAAVSAKNDFSLLVNMNKILPIEFAENKSDSMGLT